MGTNDGELADGADVATLVARAQAGDHAATAALLKRYRPLVASVVTRAGGDAPAALASPPDLWQEGSLQFLELLLDFRGRPEAFGAYVKQMLGYRLANYVRAERRRQRRNVTLATDHLDLQHDELRPNLGGGFENPRLRAACRKLSPKQRDVLYRLYGQDRAVVEVAKSLRLSPQAVTALRRRAEGRLRKDIERQEETADGASSLSGTTGRAPGRRNGR